MILTEYSYSQYSGTSREWQLNGLRLNQINLLVGKNASGKSRSLNTIHGLAKLVSGRMRPSELATGRYEAKFLQGNDHCRYYVNIEANRVTEEVYSIGGRVLLARSEGGRGTIFHEQVGGELNFQTPETELAVVARQDNLQHPFFGPLAEWADGVRHYSFGNSMGQTNLTVLIPEGPLPDPRDANSVVALFIQGQKKYGDLFTNSILDGINAIGYEVTEIGVAPPTDIAIISPVRAAQPMVIYVQERSLGCPTQQFEMSQGMFRALATVILLSYAVIASKPSCVIIDDLGEGLDFDRSCKLIHLMRDLSKSHNIQLIISTNDKFVMNEVPIEEWSVLQRHGGIVKVLNNENSQDAFEQFKFLGMSNFTFFEMDMANISS